LAIALRMAESLFLNCSSLSSISFVRLDMTALCARINHITSPKLIS
jgi:hypothetical protein